MILAFSEAVDERNEVPGVIDWILFDDNAEILAEFVYLAESLVGQKTPEDGRSNSDFIIGLIKAEMEKRSGRWLLCLDDLANEPEVKLLLNKVCSIANTRVQNGWVIVTTQNSGNRIWSGIQKEQKVPL